MPAPSRLRIGAYLGAEFALRRAHSVAKSLLDGVSLGLLSQEDLHALDERYYHQHVEYLDNGYNSRGLFAWETAALKKHFSGCKTLILTAAGGGREVLPLVRLGYAVQAFECNPRLLTAAQGLAAREGLEGSAQLASMPRDQWPAEAVSADGVIVGWGAYMLIRGRDRRLQFLAGARRALPPGGPILLSYFHRPRDILYFRLLAGVARTVARALGPAATPLPELGDSLAPNFVHHFTQAEIADELAASGFTVVDAGTDPYGWSVGVAR